MKKLTLFIMILMGTLSYSKELFKVIDTDYVLENYYKSKSYNNSIKKDYNNLSKKYKIDVFNLDYKKIKDSELKKEIIKLRKNQREYIDEINEDLVTAIYINFPNDTVFPVEAILTGKTINISDKILDFLNDMYTPVVQLKRKDNHLNDYVAN
ncbi:hypothetical protein [Fusobacterium sp. IOR10]|uniref:hypothetical protein n=1 Tax=Fusobacterium sp. IOR10 TaxID=2665157 RepID=UPI0013D2CE90|nr:hypothetical protein [Fusobacterium sp. IOR10]